MHPNSLSTFTALEEPVFSPREQQIIQALKEHGGRFTDREIQALLDYPEPGCVRPRITRLCKLGVLVEAGTKIDPDTRRPVRLVQLRIVRHDSPGQLLMRGVA